MRSVDAPFFCSFRPEHRSVGRFSSLSENRRNSIVDIGYHYVSTDTIGIPIDTNGDGIPDYISDANGNGLVDSGEIGWNITGDLGLQVIITRPRAGSILP